MASFPDGVRRLLRLPVRGVLYGVPPFDPLVPGLSVGGLLACALLTMLAPVRRATRVDPISVLR